MKHIIHWIFVAIITFGLCSSIPNSKADAVKIIRVRIGDYFYNIPTNYGSIHTGGMDTPKDAIDFRFVVLMPDFAPHTEKNDAKFKIIGWHDQIGGLFDFVPGRKVLVGKNVLAVALSDTLIDASHYSVTSNGFRVYTPRVKPDLEIHTKTLSNGDVFVMRCMQDGQKYIIFPACTMLESWQGFTLTYSFSRKYAEQADVIDQKVKAMMLGFREKS